MKENKVKNEETNKIKKKKTKSKVWKIIRLILLLILIAILVWGGMFVYRAQKNGGGISGFLSAAVGHDEETRKNLPTLYFLLLGKSKEMELTDSIMLCAYNPRQQKASILSIPRDTFVGKNANRATGMDKINALYQISPEKALNAVSELTGIEVKYYLAIDSNVLIQMVDEIGGVWFDVICDMKYADEDQDLYINLDKGYQLIDGYKSEQLLRFRHNWDGTTYPEWYGIEDYGRMRTQREFIKATVQQTMKIENIFKINQFIDIAQKNVETNLDFDTLKDYVPYAVDFNTEDLKNETLPGVSDKKNGVWLFLHDKKESAEIIDKLFNETEEEEENPTETEENNTVGETTTTSTTPQEQTIKIELLNGSDNKNALAKITQRLEASGFKVTKSGNTSVTSRTAIINRTNQSVSLEKEIRELLKVGTVSNASNNSNVDFTIIIGKDIDLD